MYVPSNFRNISCPCSDLACLHSTVQYLPYIQVQSIMIRFTHVLTVDGSMYIPSKLRNIKFPCFDLVASILEHSIYHIFKPVGGFDHHNMIIYTVNTCIR